MIKANSAIVPLYTALCRRNWFPYIPRNVILRYSQEGDLVLYQFAGGGTTLVEAKLLNRSLMGVDVNPVTLERCFEKCNFECENIGKVNIKQGDAHNLDFVDNETVDLICTLPPYSNIIRYSEDIENDMLCLEIKEFLVEMKKVATESFRIFKKRKFCAILSLTQKLD